MLTDIRELTDDPEQYAAELRRRWGGLLSYRYIGRSYAQMDLGPEDNTVTVRRDMRDGAGGLLLAVLGIASPEGGHMSDLEAVPNPVIHSCQILDPGVGVERIEIVSEEIKRGRQMGYSRSKIVDADHRARVLALTEGQGIIIGTPPAGLQKMAANPFEPLADDTVQRLLVDLEAARQTFAESVGRYRGTRLTSQAALSTEAQDYRGGDAVALGLADATGHALEAFESFAKAMDGKK